jgi:hypothetical protein
MNERWHEGREAFASKVSITKGCTVVPYGCLNSRVRGGGERESLERFTSLKDGSGGWRVPDKAEIKS